jgi:hypothetical protein
MTDKSSAESGLIVTRARKLLRDVRIASLATLDHESGGPYASMITVATAADASPVFLISTLAWHTRNLGADQRASILLTEAAGTGDPLNFGRLSVMGEAEPYDNAAAKARFLAAHPSSAQYAGFADFAQWRLRIETAHYIGGFGRIVTLPGAALLLNSEAAVLWEAGIAAILEKVNGGGADLLARLAARLRPGVTGPVRVAACDPEGCELVCGPESVRLPFAVPLDAPEALPAALALLDAQETKTA